MPRRTLRTLGVCSAGLTERDRRPLPAGCRLASASQETIKQITKVLKSPGCRKVPVFMQTMDDVLDTVNTFVADKYVGPQGVAWSGRSQG